jgi:hypothetical protein
MKRTLIAGWKALKSAVADCRVDLRAKFDEESENSPFQLLYYV